MHTPKIIIHRLDQPLHRVMARQQQRRKRQICLVIVGLLILAGGSLLRRPADPLQNNATFAQSVSR